MKKILSIVLLVTILSTAISSLAEQSSEPQTRIVTDMRGYQVEIPVVVNGYVETWASHNTIDIMLDQGEKMVASGVRVAEGSWGYLTSPKLRTVQTATFSDDMNLEEIIALKPDVIFGRTESFRDMFAKVGIPFVNIDFNSFDTMIRSVQLTAEVLGGDAIEIADRYVEYLNKALNFVHERVKDIPESDKIRVIHGHPTYELKVDGGESIVDEWITYAGGINAASPDVIGLVQTISLEMLYAWNPEVIISGDGEEDINSVMTDPAWAQLSAVKNNKVLTNPKGMHMWDRSGIEEALQVQWCASVLYPELFTDFDIKDEIKYFYQEFLHYELTDEMCEKIILHQNP